MFLSGWRLACECGAGLFHAGNDLPAPSSVRQGGPRVHAMERRVAAVGPDPWTDKTTSPPSRRPSRRHQRRRPTGAPGTFDLTAATKERNNVRRLEGRTGLGSSRGPTRGPTLPAFRWARRAHEKLGFAGSSAVGEPKFRVSSWAKLQGLGHAWAGDRPVVHHTGRRARKRTRLRAVSGSVYDRNGTTYRSVSQK